MAPHAYLFDFDGTLVDSMPTWAGKMLNILEKTHTPYPADVIKIITPLGDLGTARYFSETLHVPMTTQDMLREMDDYALPRYRDKIVLKEGVRAYLEQLKSRGAVLGILTASPHKMLDPCLKRNGIWDLFQHVWSCEDFGIPKSDPDIYRQAADKMGTSVGDTLFFDDNIVAIQTAKAAGMQTAGVYDPSGADFADALKDTADLYIRSFADLLPSHP